MMNSVHTLAALRPGVEVRMHVVGMAVSVRMRVHQPVGVRVMVIVRVRAQRAPQRAHDEERAERDQQPRSERPARRLEPAQALERRAERDADQAEHDRRQTRALTRTAR